MGPHVLNPCLKRRNPEGSIDKDKEPRGFNTTFYLGYPNWVKAKFCKNF